MAGSEWALLRLGDVCTKIGSGATPRGGSDVYLQSGPYALVRSQNIYNDGFHREGLAFIGREHAEELDNVEVREGDVLLNITGDSVGRACQVDPGILPARVNQHVAIVRPDPLKLDPSFLRYFLVSPQTQAKLLSWAGAGGTRNALTKAMIEAWEVFAPADVTEQTAVAQILGALDEKIDVNRRMAHTLEVMARGLFESWFVSFAPTRARSSGREDLTETLLDAFPDRLEPSAVGDIPAGWTLSSLDKVANFRNGLALQKYPANGDHSLPAVKIPQLRRGDTVGADRVSADLPTDYVVQDGDVLFSWSGSLECVIWTGGPGALNQHLFKVTSSLYPKWFYYLWIHQHLPEFRQIAAGKATTMGHIQRHHLTEAGVVLPDDNVMDIGDRMIAPLVERATQQRIEARVLADLRDALLPKLMSGQLRVHGPTKSANGSE